MDVAIEMNDRPIFSCVAVLYFYIKQRNYLILRHLNMGPVAQSV